MDREYFPYGDEALEYLSRRDKRLGEVIEKLGRIERPLGGELFESLVSSIVAQQISGKAFETIWARIVALLGEVTAEAILSHSPETLQALGLSAKKVEYIQSLSREVVEGCLDLDALYKMGDEEVVARLSQLRGIGVWTAEMLLIFSLKRADVLSFGDFGIQKGLRMLYHHRKVDRVRFERYRRRYSPYGTIVAFYLWEISSGAIEGMRDYAPRKKKPRSKSKAKA